MQAMSDLLGTEIMRAEDTNGNVVRVLRQHTMGQTWFVVLSENEDTEAEGWFSESEARNAAKRMAA